MGEIKEDDPELHKALVCNNAGYTPQDNRADNFGQISPLPTVLGNVPIISMVLQIILPDFPVLCIKSV